MIKEIKTESTYKGTRILLGNEKRDMLDLMAETLCVFGYTEISIPVIQFQKTFKNKVGEENNKQMFNFKDGGDRDICLAPEYTAVIQDLSKTYFKQNKDVKLFYVQECFRGEKPQAGRYRQFTQLGVEILNPTKDYTEDLIYLVERLLPKDKNFICDRNVTRGLDYYQNGKGFEFRYEELGAQKQICGGGSYDGGIGFALGIDRLLLIK